ncbi:MAG TPA: hypothetical protein VL093_05625 [Flavipsychrobacter sp.]|jgi:hypothetical protein|nr:hypothetical protein [Flavipsychrobacter sp.]
MTFAKILVLIFLFYALLACNPSRKPSDNLKKADTTKGDLSQPQSVVSTKIATSSTNKEGVEEKIFDTIFKLPEVEERARYIEKQTKGTRNLKIWIADTPTLPDRRYYWIKVGEDNGTNLVTHFNFHVYPDSMRIIYFDIESDSELTLDKWRKISDMLHK